MRSCFIIQSPDSITLCTIKNLSHIWSSPIFPTDKVFWSSLSWASCDGVNWAVQLRPADGNTPYMYYIYSNCDQQLNGSPWKLYGWVMVMTLEVRHGYREALACKEEFQKCTAACSWWQSQWLQGVSWGLCSSASLLAEMPHEPLIWPRGSSHRPSALCKDLLPCLSECLTAVGICMGSDEAYCAMIHGHS